MPLKFKNHEKIIRMSVSFLKKWGKNSNMLIIIMGLARLPATLSCHPFKYH
jgi:hypothetical protein